MAFAQVVNNGKGFITHNDQLLLGFKGHADNIWEVVGTTADVDAWIARVGGVAKSPAEASNIVTAFKNFQYTRYEFFTEVVTPAQVSTLFKVAVADAAFRPFVKQLLVSGAMDMRDSWMINGIGLLFSKGYITNTRRNSILAGRELWELKR